MSVASSTSRNGFIHISISPSTFSRQTSIERGFGGLPAAPASGTNPAARRVSSSACARHISRPVIGALGHGSPAFVVAAQRDRGAVLAWIFPALSASAVTAAFISRSYQSSFTIGNRRGRVHATEARGSAGTSNETHRELERCAIQLRTSRPRPEPLLASILHRCSERLGLFCVLLSVGCGLGCSRRGGLSRRFSGRLARGVV